MADLFVMNLLGLIGYQLVGVAIFLPFEAAFPKHKLSLFDRAQGLPFLLITAILTTIVGLGLFMLKTALHIEPLLTLRWAWGGPLIASVILLLWGDFQVYAVHRLEHRFLWRFHAMHHSIKNLSAANSYHHWTESLWLTLGQVPLLFIDVQFGPTLAIFTTVLRYQQFYLHSASTPHLGPLRWILLDNRYHRIHHSTDPKHFNKNFGAFTPLWDWLGGTLYMPKSDEWPEVGVAGRVPPDSFVEWVVWPWSGNGERARQSSGPSRRAGEVLLDVNGSA